ncbi:MAG TPA: tetratricopeptide repeat protein [Chthonomonadaceae bacterium]|nr:tetratricopeptide repeat protein [Chthonomonadaceae bacterium]
MSTSSESGLAALQRGDFGRAAQLLEEACRLDPSDYASRQYLAAAYQSLGRSHEAIDSQIAAVTLQPGNAQLRYNLGVLLERSGYVQEAKQALEQALQLQPAYPQASQALARLTAPPAPTLAPPLAGPPASTSLHAAGYELPHSAAPGQMAPPAAGHYQPSAGPYQPSAPASPYQAPAPSSPYQGPQAYGQPVQPPSQYSSAPTYTPGHASVPMYGGGQSSPYALPSSQAGAGMQPGMQIYGQQPAGPRCQSCGTPGPVRQVNYNQNIGALVIRYSKRIGGNMCETCASKYFWQYTGTTALLGWFGFISFIISPFIVVGNVFSYIKGAPSVGSKALALGLMLLCFVPPVLVAIALVPSHMH